MTRTWAAPTASIQTSPAVSATSERDAQRELGGRGARLIPRRRASHQPMPSRPMTWSNSRPSSWSPKLPVSSL